MKVAISKERVYESPGKILIVGVGNRLLGDEGLGPYVIDYLSKLTLPPDIGIIDCGCDLLNLISYQEKPRKIILVDAICAGGKPGKIHRFNFNEFQGIQTKVHSAHQVKVVDALKLLKQVCPNITNCKYILLGIEPKTTDLSFDLSKEVTDNILDLMALLLQEASSKSLSCESEERGGLIKERPN